MTNEQQERTAVVAWLRDQVQAIASVDMVSPNATTSEFNDTLKRVSALVRYANAIERGDHLILTNGNGGEHSGDDVEEIHISSIGDRTNTSFEEKLRKVTIT